jgi:thioredoxin reductase (NADPH)
LESYHDAEHFGWKTKHEMSHEWETLKTNVQMHIKSINFGYTSKFSSLGIDYINARAEFKDPHTVQFEYKPPMSAEKSHHELKAHNFLIATGCRPRLYEGIPHELMITSDDLFAMDRDPGTTLVLGGGFIALECAGFLKGLGKEVYLANRSSQFLRSMDHDMSERIVQNLSNSGIHTLIKTTVKSVKALDNGKKEVSMQVGSEMRTIIVDTILVAIGREPNPNSYRADQAGVKLDKQSGLICGHNGEVERTNQPHIYAVGDVVINVP